MTFALAQSDVASHCFSSAPVQAAIMAAQAIIMAV
jgi:hypothetical protein